MAKIILAVLILASSMELFGQTPQPVSPLTPTVWGVVYDIPATKNVKVKRDVPYSGNLTIDVYLPPNAKPNQKFPAVIFLNAIGDGPNDKLKTWEIYKSFPRLVAAHDMIGISMESDGTKIQECLRSLLDFLEKEGPRHGIDGTRLGVYAASANTTQSLVYLMNENASKSIRAAALFYGGTPAAGTKIRKDLPVLYILAEGDASGFFGQQAADLWLRVMEAKAPWTLIFASDLPHAFDAFSDNDKSRRTIEQAINFWKTHLYPVPQPAWTTSPAREIVAAIYGNDAQKAVELLSKYISENPKDVTAHIQYGRMLQQLQRFDEAVTTYEKARIIDPNQAEIYSGIGRIRLAQRRFEDALPYFEKAINFDPNQPALYSDLGRVYIGQKRYADAIKNINRAIEMGFRSSLLYGLVAFAQMNLDQNEEAVRSYEKAFEVGIPPGPNTRGLAFYNMACAYVRLKQYDKAFEMLGKAVDESFNNRQTFETDIELIPIRSDPRFQQVLARLSMAVN